MIFTSDFIQLFLGTTHNLQLPIIGLNLLIFAGFILYVINKQTGNKLLILLIVFLDFAWVVGSIILLIIQPIPFTFQGLLSIGIVAIIVCFLAVQQYRYLPKS